MQIAWAGRGWFVFPLHRSALFFDGASSLENLHLLANLRVFQGIFSLLPSKNWVPGNTEAHSEAISTLSDYAQLMQRDEVRTKMQSKDKNLTIYGKTRWYQQLQRLMLTVLVICCNVPPLPQSI